MKRPINCGDLVVSITHTAFYMLPHHWDKYCKGTLAIVLEEMVASSGLILVYVDGTCTWGCISDLVTADEYYNTGEEKQ